MSQQGFDCSTRLTLANVKAMVALGMNYVGRYLGDASNEKTIQKQELSDILQGGLNPFFIAERGYPTTPGYFTSEEGISDAKSAVGYARALGVPAGRPLYFTVDCEVESKDFGRLVDYFRSVKANIGEYKVGAYGSYHVVEFLVSQGLVDFVYQTYAWSGGLKSSHAHIYQYQNDVTLDGISVDRDEILKDPGGWNPMSTANTSASTTLLIQGSTNKTAVETLQTQLKTVLGLGTDFAIDGDFGKMTESAVRVFQQEYLGANAVDGVAGTQTLTALQKAYDAVLAKQKASEAKTTAPATPAPSQKVAPAPVQNASDLATILSQLQAMKASDESTITNLNAELASEKAKHDSFIADLEAVIARYK